MRRKKEYLTDLDCRKVLAGRIRMVLAECRFGRNVLQGEIEHKLSKNIWSSRKGYTIVSFSDIAKGKAITHGGNAISYALREGKMDAIVGRNMVKLINLYPFNRRI